MISLTDLKAWLEIDASDTTYDGLLTALETRAVAFVEAQTDRYFRAPIDVTEYREGKGSNILTLRNIVSTAPTTATERLYPGGTQTTITASDADGFEVRQFTRMTRLIRKGGYVWADGFEYEFTFKHGYAPGAEPGDIRQVVIDLVAQKFALRDSADGALQSETIGGYSYRLGDMGADMPSDWNGWRTIELWRGLIYA